MATVELGRYEYPCLYLTHTQVQTHSGGREYSCFTAAVLRVIAGLPVLFGGYLYLHHIT